MSDIPIDLASKAAFPPDIGLLAWMYPLTLRFGSTAKALLKCKLKYYRIS